MFIEVMHGKIHRAHVTAANLNYVGSITIDQELLEQSGIAAGEKVQVVNINTGARLETYTIKGERHSGEICLNGAAARHFQVGDLVIIMAYGLCTLDEAQNIEPKVVVVNEHNQPLRLEGEQANCLFQAN